MPRYVAGATVSGFAKRHGTAELQLSSWRNASWIGTGRSFTEVLVVPVLTLSVFFYYDGIERVADVVVIRLLKCISPKRIAT